MLVNIRSIMALLLVYFLTLAGIICCQEVIKMRVKEDEDVILPCSLDSTNIRTEIFDWKKDDQNVFQYVTGSHYNSGRGGQDPQFKGRVFHFEDQLQSGNASIEIRKTKVKDSGSYRCIFPHHQPETRSIIELIVVIKMRVKEDEDVILPCSLDSTNIRPETFDWKKDDQKKVFLYSAGSHYNNGRRGQDPQFKDRVFHFEDQLQSGNASIVIRKTTFKDSGSYSCIFPHHQLKIRSTILLLVDYIFKDRTEEKIEDFCLKPSVTNLHQTKDQALLQCEVQGVFPKPKVQWLDSENKTVPAEEPQETESEGKYNIILKTTVTKTGYYRCVYEQRGTCPPTNYTIYVYWDDKETVPGVNKDKPVEPEPPDSSTGLIVGFVVVLILLILVTGACLYFKRQSNSVV